MLKVNGKKIYLEFKFFPNNWNPFWNSLYWCNQWQQLNAIQLGTGRNKHKGCFDYMFTGSLLLSLRNITIAVVDGKRGLFSSYPLWQNLPWKLRNKVCFHNGKEVTLHHCGQNGPLFAVFAALLPELWFPGCEGSAWTFRSSSLLIFSPVNNRECRSAPIYPVYNPSYLRIYLFKSFIKLLQVGRNPKFLWLFKFQFILTSINISLLV